jgi:hypothetical protein
VAKPRCNSPTPIDHLHVEYTENYSDPSSSSSSSSFSLFIVLWWSHQQPKFMYSFAPLSMMGGWWSNKFWVSISWMAWQNPLWLSHGHMWFRKQWKSLSMMSYTGLFFCVHKSSCEISAKKTCTVLDGRVNHEVTLSFTLSLGLLSPPVPYFNGIPQSKESYI